MEGALQKVLAEFCSDTQGRGENCKVEHYRRANGNEYFFVCLEDHADEPLEFGRDGVLRRRTGRGTFDDVFVYCPADGTLVCPSTAIRAYPNGTVPRSHSFSSSPRTPPGPARPAPGPSSRRGSRRC